MGRLSKFTAQQEQGASFSGRNAPSRYVMNRIPQGDSMYAQKKTEVASSAGMSAEKQGRLQMIQDRCAVRGFAGSSGSDAKAAATFLNASASTYGHSLAPPIGMPAIASLQADPRGHTTKTVVDQATGPWGVFFGEGQSPYKSRYDVNDQTTWTLPQALQGDSVPRISETVEQLVFLDSNWYTEEIAPIRLTEGLSVSWSSMEFNAHTTDIVPELGVTRLASSSRKTNSASFTRRGFGFMLEHGFMNTEMGIRHYLANINQLVQATIETNKFDVLMEILSAHDHAKEYLAESGLFAGKRVMDLLARTEVDDWDILKKKKNGMEILDTKLTTMMNQWRGTANSYIVPIEVANYITQVPAEKTDFLYAGAAGPQRLADGADGLTSFRGNRVFQTRAYHVDESGTVVDPMNFPVQIGEFSILTAKHYEASVSDVPYSSSFMDAEIYDQERDRYVVFGATKALHECMRFDSAGELAEWDEDAASNYTDAAKEQDVFHHRTQEGEIESIPYFINMKSAHMSAESRLLLGETVKQQMRNVSNIDRADELLSTVRDAIQTMEDYTYQETEEFLTAWVAGQGAAVPSTGRVARVGVRSNLPLVDLQEFPVNSQSGFNTLSANINSAALGVTLPPGHQSWAGLKEIARVAAIPSSREAGGTLAAVSGAVLDGISDFVVMFSQIVKRLQTIFRDSLILDAKNASTWWQKPAAEDVLFNNFVHKYRVPLWTKAAAVAAADANLGNLTVAQSLQIRKVYTPIRSAANATISVLGGGDNPVQDLVNLVGIGEGEFDLQKITSEQYETQSKIITGYLAVMKLIAALPQDEDTLEGIRAKLARIAEAVGPIAGNTPESLAKIVDDPKPLFEAISMLSKIKPERGSRGSRTFFQNGVTAKALEQQIVAVYNQLTGALDVSGTGLNDVNEGFPTGQVGGALTRTTLLASPKMVQSMAILAAQGNENLIAVPSDPNLPDIPVTRSELAGYSDVMELNADTSNASAFIAQGLSGNVTTGKIEDLEIVKLADALEAFHKGQFGSADEATGFADDNDSIFGDEMAVGSSLGDYAGGNSFATGGPKASRASESYGVQLYTSARDALLTEGARSNFAELAAAETGGWDYIFANVFNYTRVTKQAFESIIKNNVLCPINFMISKPHQESVGCMIVKIQGQGGAIVTFQRRGRFEAGDDVAVGAHVGNYKYYSKAVAWQPKNIVKKPNAFIKDYTSGAGSLPYKRNEYRPYDNQYGEGSYFVFAIGYEETAETMPEVINLSGSNDELAVVYDVQHAQKLDYSSAVYYSAFWGFNYGKDMLLPNSFDNAKYLNEHSPVQQNMLECAYKRRNVRTKEFTVEVGGKGHWGKEGTYVGAAAARRGAYQAFRQITNTVTVQ